MLVKLTIIALLSLEGSIRHRFRKEGRRPTPMLGFGC